MKRLFVTILIALTACMAANAQFARKAKYSELKYMYDQNDYVKQASDPYSVGWYECVSFFVPGAGQIMAGEVWRGIAFVAGEVVLESIARESALRIYNKFTIDENGKVTGFNNDSVAKTNIAIFAGSIVAGLGLSIWSCIDAKKVTRVKNMYYQDLIGKRAQLEMGVAPALNFTPSQTGSVQPAAGLAFQMKF